MYRYNMPEKYRFLDGSALKLIACITMLIDHFAAGPIMNGLLLPNAPIVRGTDLYRLLQFEKVLRLIGRTAFPIFCFLLVEGFFLTKNRLKYASRLLIFGLISEVPFDLCLLRSKCDFTYQNVYFTLFFGLLAIWAFDSLKDRWYLRLPLCASMFAAAHFMRTDYGWKGVLLIFILYLMREWRIPQVFFGLLSMYWELPGVILGFIPLLFYSGRRGRQLKYFYYAFYPVHLFLLYLLTVYLVNRV